jgi:hypothetical protein
LAQPPRQRRSRPGQSLYLFTVFTAELKPFGSFLAKKKHNYLYFDAEVYLRVCPAHLFLIPAETDRRKKGC